MVKSLMRKGEFAQLCDVSAAMVSKYDKNGRIVMRDGLVDAKASLVQLEGHLDEAKRGKALKLMKAGEAEAGAGDDEGGEAPAAPRSAKAVRDEFQAKLTEIDYLERIGALVPAEEIAARVRDLVAGFFTTVDLHRRQECDKMASELGLDPEGMRKLRKLVASRDRLVRQRFADEMTKLAPDEDLDAVAKPEPARPN